LAAAVAPEAAVVGFFRGAAETDPVMLLFACGKAEVPNDERGGKLAAGAARFFGIVDPVGPEEEDEEALLLISDASCMTISRFSLLGGAEVNEEGLAEAGGIDAVDELEVDADADGADDIVVNSAGRWRA
jgi:hypothetical protein